MEFDEEDLSKFTINYKKIVSSTTMLTVTRLLASSLIINPYMRVGHFLKSLSDHDLEILTHLTNKSFDTDPQYEELLLMAEMLARAEGATSDNLDEITTHLEMFIMLIAIESLYRKGLVEVIHDNMSFGEDAGDLLIVKMKE